MRIAFLLVAVLMLSGCGNQDRDYTVKHHGVESHITATYYAYDAGGGGCVTFYHQSNGFMQTIPVGTFCGVYEVSSR